MATSLQVAESGALKKLNVEGGLAAKARAVYGALFVAPSAGAADAAGGSSSPKSPGSPRANGSSSDAAAANSSSSNGLASMKLAAAIDAALPLLQQLASDPPSQLAQLVALEWLLTVSLFI